MSTFQPHQIVYLEQGQSRLYAEAIQIVPERQLCWARPLVLIDTSATGQAVVWDDLAELGSEAIYPVVEGPDILWPLEQFKLALDTEVIPLLALMQQDKAKTCDRSRTHERLQRFIQRFWQA